MVHGGPFRRRAFGLGIVAVLLVLVPPPVAGEDHAPSLLFPHPEWVAGPAFVAELERRLGGPFGLAVDMSDRQDMQVSDELAYTGVRVDRDDGTRDEYRFPMRHGRLDVEAVTPLAIVRAPTVALDLLAPLAWLAPGWAEPISEGTNSASLRTLAESMAHRLGLPEADISEWVVRRGEDCAYSIDAGEIGQEGRLEPLLDHDRQPRLGPCSTASRGQGGLLGSDSVTIQFFHKGGWARVRSGYWLDTSGALPREALGTLLRERFEHPELGRAAMFSPRGFGFDGADLTLLRLWQLGSHPLHADRQPCEPRWSFDVAQDAEQGWPVRVLEEPNQASLAPGCADKRPVFGVQPLRSAMAPAPRSALLGPGADAAGEMATLLEEVSGLSFIHWALDWNGFEGDWYEEGGFLTITPTMRPGERTTTLRFPAVVVPDERRPPTTTFAPGQAEPEPPPWPGIYVARGEAPTVLLGSGRTFDLWFGSSGKAPGSLDDAAALVRQLGFPVPDDGPWIDEGKHEGLSLYVGGTLLRYECDCRWMRLFADPFTTTHNTMRVVLSDDEIVALGVSAWRDLDAWPAVPVDEAVARAQAALLEGLATEAHHVDVDRMFNEVDEVQYLVRFTGRDVYGIDREWTVTQHGPSGQVLHVAADPPLHPDDARRTFAGNGMPLYAAALVALVAIFITRRFER